MKYPMWILLVCVVAISWSPWVSAEDEADPFEGRLLPIELVMTHRQEIGLTKAQNQEIGRLVVEVQKTVAEKQWELQSGYFDLIELLDAKIIDEERAVAVARQAVDVENDIKTEQIRLLIRVRNLLDENQIAALRERLEQGWQAP